MGDTAPSARPRPGILSRLVNGLLVTIFRAMGWSAIGELPRERKFILAAASHTSNWDFLIFLGTIDAMGIKPRYMGKHTLFRWPLRRFMLDMGGVPVDRTAAHDMVHQMVDQFAAHDEFALVVAVEGTRSPTTRWRTGFYRIAVAAGVPIVFAGPDYERKLGVIGPTIWPTGDYEKDMEVGYAFFKTLKPKIPERALFPDGSSMADPA